MIALLILLQVADLGAATVADPRIEWVELQRSGQIERALERVDEHLRAAPRGPLPGARYLRGRLLAALARPDEAATEFAAALGAEPALEPWARLRLAESQVVLGHPEVAAGLLATLLGRRPDFTLESRAARMLATTIEGGGDCRLLSQLDSWRLAPEDRRPLELRRTECGRAQDSAESDRGLAALLATDRTDGVGFAAAERLAASASEPSATVALDMAFAFFAQRDFERALEYFARGSVALPVDAQDDYETRYAVGRSYFWLADYRHAAERFAALAGAATRPERAADAYYQQARSLELAGNRRAAETAYGRAFDADPDGSWASAALSSRLRLLWLEGRASEALSLYRQLGSHRRWQAARARAALFLAASELVAGRTTSVAEWLATVSASSETHGPEVAYWQGRLAQELGEAQAAVEHYRRALIADPWDPWALEARDRLREPTLAAAMERGLANLTPSSRTRDLLAAWMLAPTATGARDLRLALESKWPAGSAEREFLELAPVPTPAWPLWKGALATPEERMLAVGDWDFGAAAVVRHFPVAEPRLALTRALALAEAGLWRPAIRAAEVLAGTAPPALPEPLWPAALARSLYPLAQGTLIARYARAAAVDPLLMAALIREESRFDAEATSAAAARGLTQVVLPTARRLGRKLGLGELAADDLYQAETSIRLGAAYLAELGTAFDNRPHQMLAAYNAGEDQARLWKSYCLSDEPAEYLTKVGFRETRGYLRKVLESYAHYRSLYPDFGAAPLTATTPGISPSTSSK